MNETWRRLDRGRHIANAVRAYIAGVITIRRYERVPVVRRPEVLADWAFMQGSFRQGEPFDPLSAQIDDKE